MDFVEVVSAVLRQLIKPDPYGESYFIRRAIKYKVEAIIKDLGQIKNFLTNDELQKLENLLAAVYKMEDLYETFVLRRMHARSMGFGRRYIFILCQMLKLKATVDFRSENLMLLSKIGDAIKPLMNIKESGVRRGEVSDVVGLEKDKGNMVTWLTDTNSRPNLEFILISGQTGSGKTTLATEIYKSREIESHFEFRVWVSASDDPVSNLRSILQQITGDSTVDMESTVTELEEKICAILQKKRWLVVVDNVQSPIDLSKILPGSAFSDKGNGSRVILTVRSKDLIKRFMDEYGTNPILLYKLQPLQDEDAWHLFLKKVRLPDNTESDIADLLKSKIINISEGNPSAIVVLGRFLSTKKSYEEWLAVLNPYWGSDCSRNTDILASMNRELTSGSSTCLLYFGHFPKGYEIPVRRLVRLWLAEGFVTEPREQTETIPWDIEKKAEMFLHKLVERELINITERRKDGSPKTCRISGILYDICLSKAEDIFGLLHIHPTTPDHESTDASRMFGVRRVAEHGDIKNYSCKYSHIQDLRSYLSFNTQKKDTPAVEIGNFLSTEVIGHRGFGLLKVLDLERVYKPTLPHNLGKLYQLRYLGLRWTFLDTLPHSVGELSYLETLDVKHTYISSPPNSIWKMKYLRHLCLNKIRLDMPVKKQRISLPRLHTLWGLFVDAKSRVKNGLDGSINLKKLGLTFHLDSVEELNQWIASLKGLESLSLRSKDENGRPSKLKLKPLSGLKNLTNVYLLGNLPELNSEYFPRSIKVLTLSISKLGKDPMPILAKLPKLSVLQLLGDSYTGKEMVWPREGFPELSILKLWMLKELETWTVEEGVISVLRELEIRCCHKLKKLTCPQYLSWKIVLTNMPKDFVDYVGAESTDDYCNELITNTLQF